MCADKYFCSQHFNNIWEETAKPLCNIYRESLNGIEQRLELNLISPFDWKYTKEGRNESPTITLWAEPHRWHCARPASFMQRLAAGNVLRHRRWTRRTNKEPYIRSLLKHLFSTRTKCKERRQHLPQSYMVAYITQRQQKKRILVFVHLQEYE